MTLNPWPALPDDPPYVLEIDRRAVDRFNKTASDRHHIHLNVLPEPFIGRREAPLVLLNLNPGFSPQDPDVHARDAVRGVVRSNLAHETDGFYYFDPAFDDTPGGRWWRQRLGPIVKATSEAAVSTGTLVVELFGYHSVGWKPGCNVPSQAYGVALVEEAIARGATIVAMRARRPWEQLVPNLVGYDRVFSLNSVQNVTISPRNCPAGWDAVTAAVR